MVLVIDERTFLNGGMQAYCGPPVKFASLYNVKRLVSQSALVNGGVFCGRRRKAKANYR